MPAANNNSGNASNAGSGPTTGGRDRPLNPALRPQRLFHKVEIAMKTVDKKLFDRNVTGFSDLLTDDDMAHFRRAIRRIIRTNYDASLDTWPKRVLHDYKPDARKAIIQAINECWDLFDATNRSHEDSYDDFVPSELLYPRFYLE
ncbi:hypothetical protein E8E14_005951 [Neopestalotiopsis sp. 37M]|nr:hypothetical protein E8E14_005951 [Neopestalotiopsis sp. 37M]